MQRFIRSASATCLRQPARACIDAGWKFATGGTNRGLTLPELEALQRRLRAWFDLNYDKMPAQARGLVAFGLLMADGIGMKALHKAFDTDGNGRVSKKELLADVALDNRPLGAVLVDPKAVNRADIARKLGLPSGYVKDMLR
jgi:hypothetical protein